MKATEEDAGQSAAPLPAWRHVSAAGGRQKIPSSAEVKQPCVPGGEGGRKASVGGESGGTSCTESKRRQLNLFRDDWEASNYNGFQILTPTWRHRRESHLRFTREIWEKPQIMTADDFKWRMMLLMLLDKHHRVLVKNRWFRWHIMYKAGCRLFFSTQPQLDVRNNGHLTLMHWNKPFSGLSLSLSLPLSVFLSLPLSTSLWVIMFLHSFQKQLWPCVAQ